jgi:hypothetical protein
MTLNAFPSFPALAVAASQSSIVVFMAKTHLVVELAVARQH